MTIRKTWELVIGDEEWGVAAGASVG